MPMTNPLSGLLENTCEINNDDIKGKFRIAISFINSNDVEMVGLPQ